MRGYRGYNGYNGAPFGAYGAPTSGQLSSYVLAQANNTSALASIDAEGHPADMLTGPANTTGAYYRVAYWLYVASRMAKARGKSTIGLTAAASAAYAKAAGLTLAVYNPATWLFTGNENSDSIASILENGAQSAEAYGVQDVARRLRQIGTAGAIAAQQTKTAGSQPISDLPYNVSGGLLPSTNFLAKFSGAGWALMAGAALLAFAYRKQITRAITAAFRRIR